MAGQAEFTSRQRRSLAEDGYLLVPALLGADVVAVLAARLDELARAIIAERDAAGEQWDGVVSVRLDPADPGYAPLVRQPLLFSAADAVIGPGCQVDGLGLRAPLPGCGHQGLLQHESWRVRRTSAQLLDRVDLTPESVAALTRALDDEHPQVRRKAVHTLTCENCKPNGCAVDVRPAFERAIRDPSSLVRSMVVHVCTLHFFDQQWAIDLVAAVAASDKSPKLRESAAAEIRRLRKHWESDDRRRELEPDIVARTERHGGRWIVIRDGRVVATPGKAGRVFRREISAGGREYWVAPPGTMRPRIP